MSGREAKAISTRLKTKKRRRRFRFSPRKRVAIALTTTSSPELEDSSSQGVAVADQSEPEPMPMEPEKVEEPQQMIVDSNNGHKEFDHLIPDTCRKPGTSLYHCDKCPLKKYNSKTFYVHYSAHSAAKKYVCQYCDFSSDRGTALRKHERLHEQTDFSLPPLDHHMSASIEEICRSHTTTEPEGKLSQSGQEEIEKNSSTHSCTKCPLVSHNVGLFSRHRLRHGGGFARACDECDYSCNTFRGLKQHKLLHRGHNQIGTSQSVGEPEAKVPKLHINLRQIGCQQCSFTTNSQELLAVHLKKVHRRLPQRRLQCHKCPFSSTSRLALEQHKDVHVRDAESLQILECPECHFSTLDPQQLEQHKSTHDSGDFSDEKPPGTLLRFGDKRRLKRWKPHKMKSCPYCPYRAVNNMGRHVKMHQAAIGRLHTCPYCTFSTDVLNALNYHKRLHEDPSGYAADSSDDDNKSNLFVSAKEPLQPTSDHKEFSCPHCPFRTFHGSTFESHVKCHDTTVEKTYSCQLCSFRTDLAYHFANHSSVHKKPQNGLNISNVAVGNSAKEYSCLKCPYKSIRRSDFMKHLTNHGRNAEYKCSYCDYSVSMRHTLEVHQYFHTRKAKKIGSELGVSQKLIDPTAEIDAYFNDLRVLAGDVKLETDSVKNSIDVSVAEKSNGTPVKVKQKKPLYGCRLCGFKCRRWKVIEQHKRHHKQQRWGRFRCSKCDYSCGRLALMAGHKSTHSAVENSCVDRTIQPTYTCRLCSLNIPNWSQLKLHSYTSFLHRSGLRYCSRCSFTAKREESVVLHCITAHRLTVADAYKKHHIKPLTSKAVSMSLGEKSSSSQLFLEKQSGTRRTTWKCPHCPYISKYSYDLASHTRMHFGNKQFKCRFCTYNTQRHGALVHHERLHVDQFDQATRLVKSVQNPAEPKSSITPTDPDGLDQRQRSKIVVNKEGIVIGSLLTLNGYRMYSCHFCPYHSTLNSNLVSHSRLHFGERPYKCAECSFNTEVQRRLIDHKAVHRSGYVESMSTLLPTGSNSNLINQAGLKPYSKEGQMYKCQSCPFAVQSYTALWSHIQKHKQPGRYKCQHCSFQTYGTHLMKDHWKLHRNADCNDDVKWSNGRGKRQNKSVSSGTEVLKCGRCEFEANSFNELYWHKRVHERVSGSGSSLKCKSCPFVAKSHPQLWQHQKKHRGDEGTLSCTQCSFHTNLPRILEYHQKQHSSQRLADQVKNQLGCSLCPHVAENPEFLRVHSKMHLGRREFSCTDCSFSASQLKTLENHLQCHNKPLLRSRKEMPLDSSSNSSADVPIVTTSSNNNSASYGHKKPNLNCPNCPFKTRMAERLNDHEKFHQDPGKFTCKVCSFSADDQDLVLKHEVLHSHRHTSAVAQRETYKYYCPKCSFQCEFLGNFAKHAQMHGQREGYTCSCCDYSCARLGVVKYHEQNHHTHVPFVTLLKTKEISDRVASKFDPVNIDIDAGSTPKLRCSFCTFTCANPLDMRSHWGSHSPTVIESFMHESQYEKLKYTTELNLIAKDP